MENTKEIILVEDCWRDIECRKNSDFFPKIGGCLGKCPNKTECSEQILQDATVKILEFKGSIKNLPGFLWRTAIRLAWKLNKDCVSCNKPRNFDAKFQRQADENQILETQEAAELLKAFLETINENEQKLLYLCENHKKPESYSYDLGAIWEELRKAEPTLKRNTVSQRICRLYDKLEQFLH
ncbi:MAG TPA: hypothetical protein PKE69_03215 [Pyrinomonadaceae bacterium]|nr:hypothetical protein [Pyrinomonadaceae bacterium]